ncbi:MAG: hypothetical protein HQL18_01435 [Candidatus Omnitrophica bacterium]|nr:hypothetical protein [Candidatus Omnitrophota bacterium]
MSTDILEKEKVAVSVVQQKLPDPVVKAVKFLAPDLEAAAREKRLLEELEAKYAALCRQMEESFVQKEKQLVDDLQVRHAVEYARLREEAKAREKKLQAGLEAKHSKLRRDLEESLTRREKGLIEELQVRHQEERGRLEQAAKDREQALLAQLGTARRRLAVVAFAAVLGVVGIWNYKVRPKDALAPVSPSSDTSGQGLVPPSAGAPVPALVDAGAVLAVPSSAAVVQASTETLAAPDAKAAPKAAAKTGNGGNFASGKMSGK